ncbi:MAG TPA: TetR/AcrR family transcriptional regulator [Aestuariivirga sp.]|nr:TetR/AcrR family transcriptional regulator [Aestuariivirga sp.]
MTATVLNRSGSKRERILEVAEEAVLAKGFAATSIEEIITAVGIAKSGFFYHFPDKSDLAKALLQRYIDQEEAILDGLFERANELHEDPLHGFLVGLKMFAEMMSDLPSTHPGCIVASVCYQEQLFNRDVVELNASALLGWRKRFRERFELIAQRYPPKIAVDFDALADMASGLVDGGIILSRVLKDKELLPKQVMLYRDFIRAVFLGADEGRA